ncbi:hypothetical protein [Robbsia andropogonis]|uniref:hypothetical protein n=1 Tax=Robbsia andropogonis TaxID=28092 RepID=UPI0004BCCA98|nr:hypothetical protein [Robbsia andropogonis]
MSKPFVLIDADGSERLGILENVMYQAVLGAKEIAVKKYNDPVDVAESVASAALEAWNVLQHAAKVAE